MARLATAELGYDGGRAMVGKKSVRGKERGVGVAKHGRREREKEKLGF